MFVRKVPCVIYHNALTLKSKAKQINKKQKSVQSIVIFEFLESMQFQEYTSGEYDIGYILQIYYMRMTLNDV